MDAKIAKADSICFHAMGYRIEANDKESFGGAYVILPPGNRPPIEVLVLDSQQDAAQFFMLLQAKIKTALDQIEADERKSMVFGR